MGRQLAIYGLLGVLAGGFGVGFALLVHVLSNLLLTPLQTASGPFLTAWPGPSHLLLVVLPALGGLVVGVLGTRLAPEALGGGIGHVVDAYHRHRGRMRRRVPWVKGAAASITLASGGSAGLEGPVGQISAGIGAWVAHRFGLGPEQRRVLMMAGFAAGIGAVFQAPMAAAIFAAEVLYRQMDIEHEVLVPAIIASTLAHGVYKAFGGGALFSVPPVVFSSGLELVPYTLLAAVLALGATGFVKLYEYLRHHLGREPRLPAWARPAVGGLAVGVIGLFIPAVLGAGYGIVDLAMATHDAPWRAALMLLGLAVAKAVASALTTGSGGAGGLFAPSLVIGGALGGSVGHLVNLVAPGLEISPAAFVVVGMAGFFSAVSNSPLSTVIMVAELVGNYQLLVPALWVCTLSWTLARRHSLFREQVGSREEAPFRLADMMGSVLQRIPVRAALDADAPAPQVVPVGLDLRALVARFADVAQPVFPIVDAQLRILGVVDGRLLRRVVAEQGVDAALVAEDFRAPAVVVRHDESLFEAIGRMSQSGHDALPVVACDGTERVLAILSRRQLVSAYHRTMLASSDGESAPPAAVAPELEPGCTVVDLAAAVEAGGLVDGLVAADPDAVLAALVYAADLPPAIDRPQLLALLRAREAVMSTAVGDGVALPHPHSEGLGDLARTPRVVIARLAEPVDWQAHDDRPVWLVCMLLSPSGVVHLGLLGALARALHDAELRRMLAEGAQAAEVVARLRLLVPARPV